MGKRARPAEPQPAAAPQPAGRRRCVSVDLGLAGGGDGDDAAARVRVSLAVVERAMTEAEEEEEERRLAAAAAEAGRSGGGSTGAPAGSTGAPTAAAVTHGITLRGAQLTWAILNGHKRVENRHFRMSPGWYALHTGAKTSAHESQHALLAALDAMPSEASLPHCAIVGIIHISHALSLEQCAPTEPWAFGPVVNVIEEVIALPTPVPHRGALSVWRLVPEALGRIQSQLGGGAAAAAADAAAGRAVPTLKNDLSHLPPPSAAPKRIAVRQGVGRPRR